MCPQITTEWCSCTWERSEVWKQLERASPAPFVDKPRSTRAKDQLRAPILGSWSVMSRALFPTWINRRPKRKLRPGGRGGRGALRHLATRKSSPAPCLDGRRCPSGHRDRVSAKPPSSLFWCSPNVTPTSFTPCRVYFGKRQSPRDGTPKPQARGGELKRKNAARKSPSPGVKAPADARPAERASSPAGSANARTVAEQGEGPSKGERLRKAGAEPGP